MLTDARYFTHDDNARHDPKIRALIKKYGMEGYGRFWVIVENLREAKGYKLNLKSYVLDALAEQMQCKAEEVQKFINDCIKEFELFIKEEGFFYSGSLLERMAKLDNLRSKRQGAAYAMHEKYHHNITKDGNEPQD
jgi:hypothetical protein